MKCHIGVYRDANQPPDQWDGLIYLQDRRSAREFLDTLTPFLREFHANEGMDDTESLAVWLSWHLIDSAAARSEKFFEIALSKDIRSDIDFFFKISAGLVEEIGPVSADTEYTIVEGIGVTETVARVPFSLGAAGR